MAGAPTTLPQETVGARAAAEGYTRGSATVGSKLKSESPFSVTPCES